MSTTLADLESWVDQMMTKKGISNYKMDVSGNSSKGDGYLGEVTFLKVTAHLDNGTEKDFHLVVKSAKKSDEFRKQTPIRAAYEREIFIYTKIFPMFREFQQDCGVEQPFNKFAECYSVCDDNKREALIMGNLKTIGFEIHDRKSPQNLNHVLYMFQNYAKFHAISLALRAKKPALFKSMTKNMTDVMAEFMVKAQLEGQFVSDFKAVMEALKKDGKELIAKKFDGFEKEIITVMTKYIDPNDPTSVILHGDCWNNNMMFKYEVESKNQPTDMVFIDFQISRVGHPILDLSYYLYSVADKSVLQNFDVLLQAYHFSLSESLKLLGGDAEKIFTYKELKDQWKKYGKYGLVMAPFIIKIELCQADEVVDFAESAESGNVKDAFSFALQDQDLYQQRVGAVFTHFAEKFL